METGATFGSFTEFNERLKEYCDKTNSFVKRTSIKIKDPNLSHLEFENAGYVCKQGKASHSSRSAGVRPNQRSFKSGCAASFRLTCVQPKNGDAACLKISKSDFNHSGHEVSAHMLSLYPERRRIDVTSDIQMLAKTSLRASEVKAIVEQIQGVRLRPQDVKNLRLKLKGASADSAIVDSILQQLKDDGGHSSFSLDQEGSLVYLCFSTKEMVGMLQLQRFPHVLLLDFTYKTHKYLMPLLTVMAIDHYGHGCPVLHAFVRSEDAEQLKDILRFMSTLFDSSQTTCFVIDKDFSEINAVEAVCPDARINLCHFHISQAVSRHLKKLTTAMVMTVHDLFMTQVTTESLEEYGALHDQLITILPEASVIYFTNHCWNCPECWATSFNVGTMKLDATTTNHLESFHGKIKRSLRMEMGLGDNVSFLISYTQELYNKFRDSTVLDSNMRRYKTTNPDALFAAGISTFIAENILRELDLARRVQYAVHQIDDGSYEVMYKDSIKRSTPTTYDCRFHQSMRLPCRHMFFLRTHLKMPVFETALVHDMHLLGHANANSTCGTVTSTVENVRPVSVSTQEARYRRASKLCQEISLYLSILGENEFLDKYNYLSNLLRSWRVDVNDSPDDIIETVIGTDGTVYLAPVSDARSVLAPVNVHAPSASGHDSDSSDPVSQAPLPARSVLAPVNVHAPSASGHDSDSSDPASQAPLPARSVLAPVNVHAPSASGLDSDSSDPASQAPPPPPPPPAQFVNVRLHRCKVKGRPKKQCFTRKRKCKLPRCFASLSLSEKKLLLVKSILKEEFSVHETMLIDKSMLRHRYADTILDDLVLLDVVVDNFSSTVEFNEFCQSVERMRKMQVFHCGSCYEADDGEEKLVQCECCVVWFHFSCVGYKSAMNVKNWFCNSCWSAV